MLTGAVPSFVTTHRPESEPVPPTAFVFHAVEPERFERQLAFLSENGYRTLSADELCDAQRAGRRDRAVALTFDDANWTFWTVAFPLLKKYGHCAVLFVVPAFVTEDETAYPHLGEWPEGRPPENWRARHEHVPICTWRELRILHASGLVDVQAHSATHQLVPVSERVVDFLNPAFDPYWFGHIHVPVSVLDDARNPTRALRLGAPVFESTPRLGGRPRFVEDAALVETLLRTVREGGGAAFFEDARWRGRLFDVLGGWRGARGRVEPDTATEAALTYELEAPRAAIEAAIPGATVRHFCYPWFAGCARADAIAARLGYESVHYGLELPRGTPAPLRVPRLSEEYLLRLPGRGRVSFRSVWADRFRKRVASAS